MEILNTSDANQTSDVFEPSSGFLVQFDFDGRPEVFVEARVDDAAPWRVIDVVRDMKPNIRPYFWHPHVRIRVGANPDGANVKVWWV